MLSAFWSMPVLQSVLPVVATSRDVHATCWPHHLARTISD